MNEQTPQVSLLQSGLIGALIAGIGYVMSSLLIVRGGIEMEPFMIVLLHVSSIVAAVLISMLLARKLLPSILNFKNLWLTGWVSSLLLGLMVAVFYKIYFPFAGDQALPRGYFSQVLITYNIFGMAISAIFALVFLIKK